MSRCQIREPDTPMLLISMADILIVEDTDVQAALLREFVSDTHVVAGRASTSAEAVKLALTESPDVVLMDLNLDDGTGFGATAEIKSVNDTIPVIVSTVAVGDEAKDRAFEAGADAYLTKPYTQAELLETIDRILS